MSATIDIHTHPAFFEALNADPADLEYRRQALGLYKAGKAPLQHILNQMQCAGLDRLVLLPLDLATTDGRAVVSNEEIVQLTALAPERFIGFASVDPHRPEAVDALEHAFGDLHLAGLKLHPSRQVFYPADPELEPIYACCLKYNKPILFHSGISLEPHTQSRYARPEAFEEVTLRHPKLRFCLGHFGWPWVRETAALLLKYPQVYADTALLYFDSAREFYAHVFKVELGEHWIDRSLRHQVLFGSNNPRFEQIRMLAALRGLGWRESTLELVLGGNALEFLG
jgi:uncharacterized protein